MNTNELMVADLVYKKERDHYLPVGIIAIYEDNVDWKFRNTEGVISVNGIKPIPITAEILEANGFYKVSKDESENIVKPDVWIYEKNDNVIVIGLKGGDFSSFEIYNDRRYAAFTDRLYVSELQHAMRMMGMHELADNFVIEKGGNQ